MASYVYNPLTYKDFTRDVKVTVHTRDDNRCQLCLERKFLVTHHINYNKQDSTPFNLITLCWDCHTLTFDHKSDWLRLFSEKMTQRFGKDYENYIRTLTKRTKNPKQYRGHHKNGPVKIIKPA